MNLLHAGYFSSLGHVWVLLAFVFIFGTMSLVFSAAKGGGAGGAAGGKKGDDKAGGKKPEAGAAPDPGEDPTNFFDSATAGIVASTAGKNQPEAGKLPDNFFDSITMSVMGKESAMQLRQVDEIQNPKNFFDYFAEGTMGLARRPDVPAMIIRQGAVLPPVPPQPEVPFMSAENAERGREEKEKERAGNERRERENRMNEIMAAKREAREGNGERLENLLARIRAQIGERHGEREEEKKGPPAGGGGPMEKKEKLGGGMLSETEELIKELGTDIDKLLQQKWLDRQSRELLMETKDLLNRADHIERDLRQDEKEKLRELLGPVNADILEKVWEEENAKGKQSGKKEDEGGDDKGEALNSIKDNLRICNLRDEDITTVLSPRELAKQNYDIWNYAKAC